MPFLKSRILVLKVVFEPYDPHTVSLVDIYQKEIISTYVKEIPAQSYLFLYYLQLRCWCPSAEDSIKKYGISTFWCIIQP